MLKDITIGTISFISFVAFLYGWWLIWEPAAYVLGGGLGLLWSYLVSQPKQVA